MLKEEQINCILDFRVSSHRQQEGGGLDNQKSICVNFVNKKGWNILKIFSKVYSGRAEEREDFEEILGYIKEEQSKGVKVHHYVIKSIDRFTRDGAIIYDEMKGKLSHIGVQLIDAYGVIQPEQNTLEHLGVEYKWSKRSPTATAQLAEAQRAKDDVTDILTRLIGQEVVLTRDGYHIGPPDDGYLNQKVYVDGKKKPIQVPNPARAGHYQKMFELRAAGLYSDKEIVDELNAAGYKTQERKRWSKDKKSIIGKSGGLPLTVKQLQRKIQNSIYCAVICEKWTNYQPRRAKYTGLVSVETFNRANRGKVYIKENNDGSLQILYNQNPQRLIQKRLKNNPLFPYKFLPCSICRKPLRGSSPRGKSGEGFPAYHCARGHKYLGINKKEFEGAIERFLDHLQFATPFSDSLQVVLIDKYREKEKEVTESSSAISRNVADLKSEKARLLDSYTQTESKVIKRDLEQKIESLDAQIIKTEEERTKIEITEGDIRSFIHYATYLMEHPKELLLDSSNMQAQQALFGLVFEELPTYEEIANGTPKLSLVFKLSNRFLTEKSQLAAPRGVEPRLPA